MDNQGAILTIKSAKPVNIFFITLPRKTKGENLISALADISLNVSEIAAPNTFIPSAMGFNILPILPIILLNIFDDLTALSILTIKSPIPAVNPRIPSPAGATYPIRSIKPPKRALIT